ncbi:hypothetical protein PAXRUDRAFT_835654 [Paxillus rubicundulus Ve08.2h10]|uniref:Uncharacterized protein n=1 Tax=Paxillus rubicundulus Ve08.2h10 TaxID=930991 RepID=A0A0D0D5X7_9AGAM|nr:hypothetical protein PAXRUDRAFT_835654 [Paxillus rubicundulus Ve08.2h10]
MVSGKAKVTCSVIYGRHVAREQQLDQEHISTGQRDSPRDLSAITGAPQQEYHELYSPHKGNRHAFPPGVSGVQPLTLTIAPTQSGLFSVTSAHTTFPGLLPMLSTPLTSALPTSSSLLAASSTYYGSIPASLAISEIGQYHSGSGSVGPSTSTAPPGSPNPAFYWSTEVTWTEPRDYSGCSNPHSSSRGGRPRIRRFNCGIMPRSCCTSVYSHSYQRPFGLLTCRKMARFIPSDSN